METEITMEDMKLFLIKNMKLIISIMLLVTLAGVGFTSYREINGYVSSTEIETSTEKDVAEMKIKELIKIDPSELSVEELNMVTDFLGQESYYFRLFIEHPDFRSFGRTELLYEAMLSEDVLAKVNNELEMPLLINPKHLIHATYNSDNFLHTFIFTTGNKSDSEALAKAYFEILTDQQLDILEERKVFVFDQPSLIQEEDSENVGEELVITQPEITKMGVIKSVIISGLVSVVCGLFFGLVIAIVVEKTGKNIGYLFNYYLNNGETMVELNHKEDKEALYHILAYPSNTDKVILCEQSELITELSSAFGIESTNESEKTYNIETSILNTKPQLNVDDIYIIIKTNETSKQWFNNQMNYLKTYNIPKKIIKLY